MPLDSTPYLQTPVEEAIHITQFSTDEEAVLVASLALDGHVSQNFTNVAVAVAEEGGEGK